MLIATASFIDYYYQKLGTSFSFRMHALFLKLDMTSSDASNWSTLSGEKMFWKYAIELRLSKLTQSNRSIDFLLRQAQASSRSSKDSLKKPMKFFQSDYGCSSCASAQRYFSKPHKKKSEKRSRSKYAKWQTEHL